MSCGGRELLTPPAKLWYKEDMKLSKTKQNELAKKLRHIVGTCDCPATSKTCTYWKNTDRSNRDWQVDLIMKEISKL